VQSITLADRQEQQRATIATVHVAPGASSAPTPALKYWRTKRALLQRELAERAKIHITTLQRAEAGQPLRLNVIRRLAAALSVDPADLQAEPPDA
jgi:DNA-binding Xre family transcriptional regulator